MCDDAAERSRKSSVRDRGLGGKGGRERQARRSKNRYSFETRLRVEEPPGGRGGLAPLLMTVAFIQP